MAPLALPRFAAHIRRMASRPCKPDADLKRLWRTLLPGTPFPACGSPEDDAEPAAGDATEPAPDTRDGAEPRRTRTEGRRIR